MILITEEQGHIFPTKKTRKVSYSLYHHAKGHSVNPYTSVVHLSPCSLVNNWPSTALDSATIVGDFSDAIFWHFLIGWLSCDGQWLRGHAHTLVFCFLEIPVAPPNKHNHIQTTDRGHTGMHAVARGKNQSFSWTLLAETSQNCQNTRKHRYLKLCDRTVMLHKEGSRLSGKASLKPSSQYRRKTTRRIASRSRFAKI